MDSTQKLFLIITTVVSLVALALSIYAIVIANKTKTSTTTESFVNDNGVDFYSYCVQQALDNNVLDPALIPTACASQDAYLLSAGVFGGQR